MNKVVKLLMKELDVEIDELFDIEGCISNPFHFNKNGNLIDFYGEQRNSLLGMLILKEAKIKKIKTKGKFVPKKGEEYWMVNQFGNIANWNNNNKADEWPIKHSLVFKTKAEAEDYKWFLGMLDKYSKEFEYGSENYYFYYNYRHRIYRFDYVSEDKQEGVHYFTKDNLFEFMGTVGDDRIRKYMLGIYK